MIDEDTSWLRSMRRLLTSLDVRRLYLSRGPDRIGLTIGSVVGRLDAFIVLTDMAMQGEPLAGLAVIEVAQRVGLPVGVISTDLPAWHVWVQPRRTPVPFLKKYDVCQASLYRLIRRIQQQGQRPTVTRHPRKEPARRTRAAS